MPVVISTDAHSIRTFELMRYGVRMARRGWLEKKDVLNTLPLPKLLAALRPARAQHRRHAHNCFSLVFCRYECRVIRVQSARFSC